MGYDNDVGNEAAQHLANSAEWEKAVGLTLALSSGVFIGSSFIFKKKGLLESNALSGQQAGEGHSYLKSKMWWTGMILMGIGELANFGAYAFVPAILITPLGALSVVISAVLSSIFLNENLDFAGKIGCIQCVLGALIIAPKYGDKHPLCYILICSLMGSFLVLSCQGFGSSLVHTFTYWTTENQFLEWPIYPLIGFIVFSLGMQINYLNKALNLFSTAVVTPVYYVFFTGATLLTSAILFRGFHDISVISGISIMIGFMVIVGGVSLLFQGYVISAKESSLLFSPLSRNVSIDEGPNMLATSEVSLPQKKSLKQTESVVSLKSNRVNSFHEIIEMQDMEMVSTTQQQRLTNDLLQSFTNKKKALVGNNKVKHSPTPSQDITTNFSSKGIASCQNHKNALMKEFSNSELEEKNRSASNRSSTSEGSRKRNSPKTSTINRNEGENLSNTLQNQTSFFEDNDSNDNLLGKL
ncbi:hypothetical protein HK099_006713 [Clydaea vesicula]|uniref:Magnesium transporter n=1 Tax=Clydaea vesicula TaxID=447962 RepID=A0AAD5UBF4_9FUNG|nr:hypothetical protein HK099_006713 [Clydaea vesicula]